MIEREEIAVRLLERMLAHRQFFSCAALHQAAAPVAVALTDKLLAELSKETQQVVTPDDVFAAASDGGIHVVEVGTIAAVDRIVAMLRSRGIVAT